MDDDAKHGHHGKKPHRRRPAALTSLRSCSSLTLAMGVALIIIVAIINVLTHTIPVRRSARTRRSS